MPKYNKQILAEKAKELSVVRDTLEKVMRLRDILAFFDNSELLSDIVYATHQCIQPNIL